MPICEEICIAHYLCKNAQMVRWSDLEVFLSAVRTGSYTVAGRQLGVNRTTIARRVEALEQALGIALFDYSALGPAPTVAGERVLVAALAIEREIALMGGAIGGRRVREAPIRIAGSAGLVSEFLPDLARFGRANPACPIEILDDLDPIAALTQRRADLALALVRTPPLRVTGHLVATLQQAPYGLAGAADLALLGWGLDFESALSGAPWTTANPLGEAARERGLVTCNSWPQIKLAVLSGIGRASLWCFVGDAQPTLEQLGRPDPRNDCPLWLLHRAKAPPGAAMQRLIAFLAEAIANRIES
jgi:DNA-binding transcriptional LysR family regulator